MSCFSLKLWTSSANLKALVALQDMDLKERITKMHVSAVNKISTNYSIINIFAFTDRSQVLKSLEERLPLPLRALNLYCPFDENMKSCSSYDNAGGKKREMKKIISTQHHNFRTFWHILLFPLYRPLLLISCTGPSTVMF